MMIYKETESHKFKYVLNEMYEVEYKNNRYYYIIHSHMVYMLVNYLERINMSKEEFRIKAGLSDYQLKKIIDGYEDPRDFDMFSYGDEIKLKTKVGAEDKLTACFDEIIARLKEME